MASDKQQPDASSFYKKKKTDKRKEYLIFNA